MTSAAAEAFEDLDDLHNTSTMIVQLAVHTLTGMTVIPETSFSVSARVAVVQAEVEAVFGLPVRKQSLIWQDSILDPNTPLGDLDLPLEGSVLQLVVTLPPEEQVAEARQAMEEAARALDVLQIKDIRELKMLSKPPGGVDTVLATVMCLLAGINPTIEVDLHGRVKDASWNQAQKIMKDPKKLLSDLLGFKVLIENGSVPARNVQAARRARDPMGADFRPAAMEKKSKAAAGLCCWVVNIMKYHEIVSQIRSDFEGFDIMAEIREQSGQQ